MVRMLYRYKNGLGKISNHFLSAYPQNKWFTKIKIPNHFVLSIVDFDHGDFKNQEESKIELYVDNTLLGTIDPNPQHALNF